MLKKDGQITGFPLDRGSRFGDNEYMSNDFVTAPKHPAVSATERADWAMLLARSVRQRRARLCKALLDRITDRAHIIETGTDSYRFRRTMEKGRSKKAG